MVMLVRLGMAFIRPMRISRSGLKLFLDCPRCFWLDTHHKIKRPPSYPYTLASAVDYLVKQEFDTYRVRGALPEVLVRAGVEAKLYDGPDLETWRNNFKGIAYTDEDLQATLYGAVDDVLRFADGSLAVVDYKSTGAREITIYADYQKQMDTYTYILQRMGYATQSHAYFVFYMVDKTGGGFKDALPFTSDVRRVAVDPTWVPNVFERAVVTSRQSRAPAPAPQCVHCHYVANAAAHGVPELAATDRDADYVIVPE